MKTPRWLTVAEVLTFHTKQMNEHGGVSGLRDRGLLESAMARPQHLFDYSTDNLFSLATAYAYGIVKNHPFVDGNKRTAITSAGVFLILNNYMIEVPEVEVVTYTIRLASGDLSEEEFTQWLQIGSQKIS